MDQRLKQHPLGFWEIAEKPTAQELQRYYANKYYQEAKGSYELEYTKDELLYFRAKLEQRYAVLQHYLPQVCESTGRLLDVGCGEGYALAFFREQGWSVKGIDFSSAGVKAKNPGCTDALVTGDIFALLRAEIATGATYDVVWLQNVLEHVIDPLDLLDPAGSDPTAKKAAIKAIKGSDPIYAELKELKGSDPFNLKTAPSGEALPERVYGMMQPETIGGQGFLAIKELTIRSASKSKAQFRFSSLVENDSK